MKYSLFLFTVLFASKISGSEQENCPICFENLSSPELMSCGKNLCLECLMKTLNNSPEPRCPFCRDPFTIEFLQDLANRTAARTCSHVQKALKSFAEKMLEKQEFKEALRFCERLDDNFTRPHIQAFALASLGRLDDAIDKLIETDTEEVPWEPWKFFEKNKATALALEVVERWLESPDKIHSLEALRHRQIDMLMELKRFERVLEVIKVIGNSHEMNILRFRVLGRLNRVSEALDEIDRAASQEDFSFGLSFFDRMGGDTKKISVSNACMSVLREVADARGARELEPEIMAVQRFPENEKLRSLFVNNIHNHANHGRFFLLEFNRKRLIELMEDGHHAEAKQLANLLVRDDQKINIIADACVIANIIAEQGDFVKAIEILDVMILLGLDVEELQMRKERLQNRD